MIQSKLHKVGTYQVFKIYLSCFDDKRYIYIYIYWMMVLIVWLIFMKVYSKTSLIKSIIFIYSRY